MHDGELIGREGELERLAALLARPAWVTLVGLPGAGKSALARAALAAAGGESRVLLADDARSEDVPGLRVAAGDRAVIAVAAAPLAVLGEHVVRVAPLAVPSRGASLEEILASPAVRAVLRAAERAGAPIEPLEPLATELAELARRTSGLPLAIELVGASLPVLPLATLTAMLARPGTLEMPAGPERPARHASVLAALGPAIEALPADARALLVRAAPHVRGIEIADPRSALGPLRALIDAGLVERASDGVPPRYRAHALVGALALELAAADEAEAAHRAHAEAIAARLREASSALWRTASPSAAAEIAALEPDLEALLERAEASRDSSRVPHAIIASLDAARAAGALPPERLARLEALAALCPGSRAEVSIVLERARAEAREARAAEALHHLDRAARIAEGLDGAARGEVALERGLHFRDVRRDYAAAQTAFEVAAGAGDPTLRIQALLAAGGSGIWAERYGDAVRAFGDARRALAGLDAPRLSAVVSTNLAIAWIGHWPGPIVDPPRTRVLDDARRAVATFEAIGEARGAGVARQAVALTLTTLLRFEEARAELHVMRERIAQAGDRRFLAVAHANLGDVALARGAWDEASAHLAQATEIARSLEDRLLTAVAAASEGDLAWERGELGRARDSLSQARRLLEQDEEHASRLALVLAEQSALSPESVAASLLLRASELAGDESNVHRHCVAIYAALAARRAGSADLEAEARDVLPWMRAWVALARVAPERRGGDGHGLPFATWLALRRFVRALDDGSRRALLEAAYQLDAPPGPTLLLDPERRAVRAPDGTWIDLSRRDKPFALLEVLAAPSWTASRTFAVGALVERVWAGEKVLPDAGANRVYVAMAALRKQRSLRDLIQSEGEGYRLAPELEVLVFRERE